MTSEKKELYKKEFKQDLRSFVENQLKKHLSADDGQWTVKGFIDIYRNVYTISTDTKIISKILEIHIFPLIIKFAAEYGYNLNF